MGVFAGQDINKTIFSMPSTAPQPAPYSQGYGNRLRLSSEELLANVRQMQLNNGLKQSDKLDSLDFTIEMETGTGKTYVYLRSIFEMNKQYGFTKFIIVVPSIAIKEGVYKSLQMVESHLYELYDNAPFDYFLYDSNKPRKIHNQILGFVSNNYIQIMIINIDAFRKSFIYSAKESSANIIHRWSEGMQGRPIDFIKSTNPIVIIDEPQSVDTTAKSAEAIKSLNPLCTFRYSATHREKHSMLYKLDAIDAYEQKLVKQIEVASIQVRDAHNNAYVKLLAVDNKSGHRAKIEFDIQQQSSVKRVKRWVKQGDDLFHLSKWRSIYEGHIINDIYCEAGSEYIDFTSKPDIIRLHQAIGDIDMDFYKRLQIRKTIEEHLDKELRLQPMGIKVLSLFFIDKVANYRDHTQPDNKGKYATMFEEEYGKAIKKPKYTRLFAGLDTDALPALVHNGYFSKDKQGALKDTKGTSAVDEDTYSLIMRDKEKLLNFASKLKFIFSHSALKEGWDNPNVFQICTLNETQSGIKKRQEIGRGLRICVNQAGERVPGFDINTLTVMANESYDDFVSGLQKEIEEEDNIEFGVIAEHGFANIVIEGDADEPAFLGAVASAAIWENLLARGYINSEGKLEDRLKIALRENLFQLPEQFAEHHEKITDLLKKIAGGLNIKNHSDKCTVRLNKAVFESPEFKQLWDRIKHKTTYKVKFNPAELIDECAINIRDNLVVGKAQLDYSRAKAEINRSGISANAVEEISYLYEARDYDMPDILSYLQNETNLKRRSILDILLKSGRLPDFRNNPQKFIDGVKGIIKQQMRRFIVDGIKYDRIGDDHFYAQELFANEELIGYLHKNMMEAGKSAHDHVVYDSDVESRLAKSFESHDEVKVYAKLPGWFKIDTPLGSYNPDWAVLFERDGEERLYFVVESKGSAYEDDLRPIEKAKIRCGKAHFVALGTGAKHITVSNYEGFAKSTNQVIGNQN